MKKYFLFCSFSVLTLASFAQQNLNYTVPDDRYQMAKEYFQKGQYNLAYPLLKELLQTIKETDRVNNSLKVQEIEYYTTVAALTQMKAVRNMMRNNI
jgi:hypothetical protein